MRACYAALQNVMLHWLKTAVGFGSRWGLGRHAPEIQHHEPESFSDPTLKSSRQFAGLPQGSATPALKTTGMRFDRS
jgi:hypothetical protein